MAQPLLSVENLRIEFPTRHGTLVAIDDASFHIDAGEILGVFGESGAGKSVTGSVLPVRQTGKTQELLPVRMMKSSQSNTRSTFRHQHSSAPALRIESHRTLYQAGRARSSQRAARSLPIILGSHFDGVLSTKPGVILYASTRQV